MRVSNREPEDKDMYGAKVEEHNALGLQRVRDHYAHAQLLNASVNGENTDMSTI